MSGAPAAGGWESLPAARRKALVWALVLGFLAALGYANYQLVRVSLSSESGCVAHSPPGTRSAAPSAAKSSCRPPPLPR